MIEICNFTKTYKDGTTAVKNFDLICPSSTVTGLLGTNGAGKSTILKAVCSIIFPTEGCINVSGFDTVVNGPDVKNIVGYVDEQSSLFGDKTVCQCLYDTAFLHGLDKKSIERALLYVRKLFNLDEVWTKKIKKLSKGFTERVSFANCLVYNPSIIVLDEGINGLDPVQILNYRKIISLLKKNHTILISTHIMQEAEALCDKICIIDHGKKIAEGSLNALLQRGNANKLEEAFVNILKENNV